MQGSPPYAPQAGNQVFIDDFEGQRLDFSGNEGNAR